MNQHPLIKSLIFGLSFGLIDSLLMIPIPMEGKMVAVMGAFFSRFAIGFLIPLINLNYPGWVKGLIVSLLISLPDAIITAAYLPILITGSIGGLIIGWLDDSWKIKHTRTQQ